jgi:hypothetical protein
LIPFSRRLAARQRPLFSKWEKDGKK